MQPHAGNNCYHTAQCLDIEIEKLTNQEELYWRQRSKANWLSSGDWNTKFFHAFALDRKKQNNVKGIVNSHRNWCPEDNAISNIILDYFSKLFTYLGPTNSMIEEVISSVDPLIDAEIND